MVLTALYHKATVLLGTLGDKEDTLPDWKRKLIFQHLEEAQLLMETSDRRKDSRRAANGHR